jgi:hypothetical protein
MCLAVAISARVILLPSGLTHSPDAGMPLLLTLLLLFEAPPAP